MNPPFKVQTWRALYSLPLAPETVANILFLFAFKTSLSSISADFRWFQTQQNSIKYCHHHYIWWAQSEIMVSKTFEICHNLPLGSLCQPLFHPQPSILLSVPIFRPCSFLQLPRCVILLPSTRCPQTFPPFHTPSAPPIHTPVFTSLQPSSHLISFHH